MSRTARPGDVVAFTLLDGVAATAYTIALRRLSDNTLVVGPTTVGVTEQDPGGTLSNYTGLVTVPLDAVIGDYQGEFTFNGVTYADDEVLDVLSALSNPDGALVRTFTGYTPIPRYDDLPWTDARIEEAPSRSGPWTALEVIPLDPVDTDPTTPAERNFTTEVASLIGGWYRIVFMDATGDEQLTDPVSPTAPSYLPNVDDVAVLLRTRTTGPASGLGLGGDTGPEDLTTFTATSRPTATEVESLIIQAGDDVGMRAGYRIPSVLVPAGRAVVAKRASMLVMQSFFPEQAGDNGMFITLRFQFEEQMRRLVEAVQMESLPVVTTTTWPTVTIP